MQLSFRLKKEFLPYLSKFEPILQISLSVYVLMFFFLVYSVDTQLDIFHSCFSIREEPMIYSLKLFIVYPRYNTSL